MAYAAVISLKQTIQRLLNSSQISIVSSSREIIEFAYKEALSLQEFLTRQVNVLDGRIREAACKLEDVLESHVSNQIASQSESPGDESHPLLFSIDLQDLKQEIHSFSQTVRKMERAYGKAPRNMLLDEDDDAVSSSIDFGVKMVGLSDEFADIKNYLLTNRRPDDFGVFSIVGMAGTGRTIVAKTIFEDSYVGQERSFDCGAWVNIGPIYEFKEILVSILAQIDDSAGNDELLISEGDEKLAEYLYTSLKGRRYMIVLDDIWEEHVWDYLRSCIPEQNNGSLVLLTTTIREIAIFAKCLYICEMTVLDENKIWDILRLAMFGIGSCPPELEEAGKQIARNCEGLRITLAKVILSLSKAEKTPEYWSKIAIDKENSMFMVDDEISEICKIKEDMQLYNSLLDDVGRILTIGTISSQLQFSNLTEEVKQRLFPKRFFPKMEIITYLGMAGIGKTAFVKEIFEDPSILCHFDHHAWVTLGPKYQSEEILVDILAQIYPGIDMHDKVGAKLAKDLCAQLSNKRCLIVLDDVWSKEPLHYLKKLLPHIKGEVLVTTRLAEVAQFGERDMIYKMCLLNKEDSWCLLRQKVFANGLCPRELEKAGKRISEKCEGLPLLILTVADLLSKAEKTPEYWNKVADKENSVFIEAHDQMSKVLSPNYKYLPQHLKACFLYMGVFPQNYEIPYFKLTKLWIAEGFLEPNPSQTIEDFAAECLSELVDRNLVMVCQKSSKFGIKTCSLHSIFWYLSNREAVKNKLFHALNSYANDPIDQGIQSQRRLCIRNSILLGIKDVHNLMASISNAHSLVCTGPPHQYPVPVYFGMRLLRVLEALTILLYEFPIEVLKLVQLRYLALTCNDGKLPISISKLWNLHFLIIRRHLSIKSRRAQPYLPMEIWDMKELKHLQIMGSNLPNPNRCALLPNLLTLLDVSAHSCTERVFNGIPNLKRLGILIELAPDDDGEFFHCLNHIFHLHSLESLKCVIVNPEIKSEAVAPPVPLSMFPSGLKKLSLSGLGYPWEYMSIIGSLPRLEVLKLRCFAFRGPEWETDYYHFRELKYLLIEDTDLVRWKLKVPSLHRIQCLSIKHCYKLEDPPSYLPRSVNMIEVVDCNPLAVTWAKKMVEFPLGLEDHLGRFKFSTSTVKLHVHSSWDDGNLKQ